MNQVQRRGPIARFFIGLWDAMNFTRRLIFNLVFFTLLFIILAAISAGDRTEPLLERTTLVIAPEGTLVEQFSADPATRSLMKALGSKAGEVQLRDLVRALDQARDDKRIERVVLQLDKLGGGGMASRRELAAAVARVRESGKQVVAFSESMAQSQYLIAAEADEVYLDPMGGLLLEGLGRYRQYYREGLQDKLGVDVHLFKVGEYKSAAEPYVLDAASPESKEADLFWMNDLWQRYLADIGKARGLAPAKIAADIAVLPAGIEAVQGDLAQYALQHELVDGLKTRGDLDDLLVERGVADADADGGFRQVSLDGYLAHLDTALKLAADRRPQVAVVVAAGSITGGEQPPGTIGGDSTSALLRQARDDDKVKAVVLRVNSPGGEVFASEQIRREVVALQEAGKPVVVSMGDLAASGGYWISMNADRIYADASTISGSIGIFGMLPTIPRALDKIGVHTDGVGTTAFAGAFDISRPMDPAVGQVIQAVIDKGYRDFIGKVAEARGQPVEAIDAVARGRVWSGAQAKERGLVDELGNLRSAISDAATRVELGEGEYAVTYVEKVGTPFEQWFGGFASSRLGAFWLRDSGFARGLVAQALPHAQADLKLLEGAITPTAGVPVKALAYCFCALD
ncbi:endopeptidase IV [Lysobacter concretionis Ko07 = DSM 16239]|uniref:Endopeptidase IV n=1 Tax=Lysobacter concretionis Ko07 = DSM 16239 TaxID=1122185 RepID=A0A0A0EQR1_9GAMM|nr:MULTISPECIES: signal peptide peptidase SppA [Lysobacter]KGM52789.1 endopeptidase IV [Lysobacter concretionis Ko07 = DSM 16239]QOD91230.1 signal peptide peptidase SppA [Lysobacter sp. CW239]